MPRKKRSSSVLRDDASELSDNVFKLDAAAVKLKMQLARHNGNMFMVNPVIAGQIAESLQFLGDVFSQVARHNNSCSIMSLCADAVSVVCGFLDQASQNALRQTCKRIYGQLASRRPFTRLRCRPGRENASFRAGIVNLTCASTIRELHITISAANCMYESGVMPKLTALRALHLTDAGRRPASYTPMSSAELTMANELPPVDVCFNVHSSAFRISADLFQRMLRRRVYCISARYTPFSRIDFDESTPLRKLALTVCSMQELAYTAMYVSECVYMTCAHDTNFRARRKKPPGFRDRNLRPRLARVSRDYHCSPRFDTTMAKSIFSRVDLD